jgi:hypothetical protein
MNNKMKRLLAAVAVTLPLAAQATRVEKVEDHVVILGSPGVMIGGSGAQKGAPYSAESITESVQTLADGNRIQHRNTMIFYRDAEGRTRRESSLRSFGQVGQSEQPQVSITIDDPVAGVHYVLRPESKSAHKIQVRGATGVPGRAAGSHPGAGAPPPGVDHLTWTIPDGQPGGTSGRQVIRFESRTTHALGKNVKSENLGSKMIEGVNATGTRSTITIPAGEAGNEKAIEIVTETWHSDQTKGAVLTIHKDPRHGETTTRLVNIRLGEPPAHLFEVPAGFTIDTPSGGMFERRIELRKRHDEI